MKFLLNTIVGVVPVLILSLPSFLQPRTIEAQPLRSLGADACEVVPVLEDEFVLPDGGRLRVGSVESGHINSQKDIVTAGSVFGVERNQGVFILGPAGVREIVRGCGGSGGSGNGGTCGDPTPIGGTFAGLFDNFFLEPRMNDLGDVVFLADVSGGSSARGLFLYRASNQTITKVAALGDPSPRGGFIRGIGNGVINNQGHVAFLAWDIGTSAIADGYLAVWDGSSTEVVVAGGDIGPGGVTIDVVVSGVTSFFDGTRFVLSPTPSIDDDGRIAVAVDTTPETTAADAIVLIDDGVLSWLVRTGDPMPGGGTFTFIGTPSLRNGRAAFETFFPDGLFVGTAGNWQRVWFEGDIVDGIATTEGDVISGRHILDDHGGAVLTMRGEVDGVNRRILARWRPGIGLRPLLISGDSGIGDGKSFGISQEVSSNRNGDVAFHLSVQTDDDFFTGQYRIDNCGAELFFDSFESGDTSAWTVSQP